MAIEYSREERVALARALATGEAPECPRCGGPMARTDVEPRPDVPYVRARTRLLCQRCGGRVVMEAREVRRVAP